MVGSFSNKVRDIYEGRVRFWEGVIGGVGKFFNMGVLMIGDNCVFAWEV